MKKIVKNKKILICVITTLILISLIVGGIFLFSKDDEEKTQNKETTNNYVAYVKINPLIKIEYSQTCNQNTCNDPVVTKYELINDDAKNIYKDIDLIGTNNKLYDVLTLISKTAEDNNVEFENVEIYSNWDNLNNYIDNADKDNYKWSYIVNIRDKENLEDISSSLEENKILYNVEFDTDGGNEINTQTVEKGNFVNQPTTPTKKGYKFIEWQLNGEKFDFKQEITSNITLKAKWEKIENTNNNSNENENNTNSNNNNNTTNNNQNNTNKNEETPNNTKPVEKAYLSFRDLYSLEKVKEIENKYNIKINLIADATCGGYLDGGDSQLIENGKTYTAHIHSLEPYVQDGGCGVVDTPKEYQCIDEHELICAENLMSRPELLACAKEMENLHNEYLNFVNNNNNIAPLISDINISKYTLLKKGGIQNWDDNTGYGQYFSCKNGEDFEGELTLMLDFRR